MLLPAVMSAREAARRMECSNNLKQIGLAMWAYRSMNGDYPPAYVVDDEGNPLYSWRVLLLPFMEQQILYDQFDLENSWDSPGNLAVTETTLQVFQCPSKSERTEPFTDYMVVVGPENDVSRRGIDGALTTFGMGSRIRLWLSKSSTPEFTGLNHRTSRWTTYLPRESTATMIRAVAVTIPAARWWGWPTDRCISLKRTYPRTCFDRS